MEKFHHAVLVVAKDEHLTGWVEKKLAEIGIEVVSAPSGGLGIERIRSAVKPFSIIISAQHLLDIQGMNFWKKPGLSRLVRFGSLWQRSRPWKFSFQLSTGGRSFVIF